MVRLEGYESRRPAQLSGGQRQRVALARALVNRPRVLLLDEPLGALDLKLRQEMQIELKTIQQEVGITFIYVTHDQEEALAMSDRMADLQPGAHRAGRSPRPMCTRRPRRPFVAGFVGASNIITGAGRRGRPGQDGNLHGAAREDPPRRRGCRCPRRLRHRHRDRARRRLPRVPTPAITCRSTLEVSSSSSSRTSPPHRWEPWLSRVSRSV